MREEDEKKRRVPEKFMTTRYLWLFGLIGRTPGTDTGVDAPLRHNALSSL